ncbi:MAG: AMP-binding protein [Propionibacteriaceae bacterium]|nr:AMP-binding protein [Propionibacteriaceae bacterium]
MAEQYPWLAHYPSAVPPTVKVPSESLTTLIAKAAKADPKATATSFFGATMTYGKLYDQVLQAAEGLRRLGIGPGDRVAIILPNCPQHIVAFYAVLRLGAIVVEHNPLYTSRELRHMLEDHAARVAICWDVAVPKLREQPGDVELDQIISVNLTHAMPVLKSWALHLPGMRGMRRKLTAKAPGTMSWEKLLKVPPLADDKFAHAEPDELACIQYTSGTTAQPKGAMLTHRNIYADTVQARTWLFGLRDGVETFYAVLPMFHVFGLTLNMTLGVLLRAQIVLFPTPDPAMVLDEAKRRPPTVIGAVPPIFAALAALALRRHISLASAQFCFSGAMALTREVNDLWESAGGGHLVEGYGMTESSPASFGNPMSDERRLGTIGLPWPSMDVKVVDQDDPSREMPPGEPGELLIKGPNVFVGYWNNPLETAATLLPDGWLRTGDIVVMDEEGFTTVVDRKKELIITSGFNVAPTEVESVLRGESTISDVAVVGVPDRRRGEMVVAAVVLKPDATLDEDAIRAFAKQRLTGYKVPRRFIALDELPKSILGKVLRTPVREQVMAQL